MLRKLFLARVSFTLPDSFKYIGISVLCISCITTMVGCDKGNVPVENPSKILVSKYDGGLKSPVRCESNVNVAVLSFRDEEKLWLNLMRAEDIPTNLQDLLPFDEYDVDSALNSGCPSNVKLIAELHFNDADSTTSFSFYTFTASSCEAGDSTRKLYALLPNGLVVPPLEASRDLLTSKCRSQSDVEIVELHV